MASSADGPNSTSHHILDCIHPARKPCGDRCWYYWFPKQPSPASINKLSPGPVDIASLRQKEVRLKAKQERQVKIRTESEEVGSAFTAVRKYSNQEGKTVRQNWGLPPYEKPEKVKAPEAQAGGTGDMDAVDHMIDILAEDSSMHQTSIEAPQEPRHTPTHARGSQDAAKTRKKSLLPYFTLPAINSPPSAGRKGLSSTSETNQLLPPFKPSKRKHSEDTTSDTPNKRPSSSSTSTSTPKPSSSSNTNMAENAMDNITTGDVVTEVDVTLTMDKGRIAKRKHPADATLDTPNKRPSISPNIEDSATSEVVHGNNYSLVSVNNSNDTTLTSIPKTPPHQEILLETPGAPVKPTSKRKHSADASHFTINKRQTPSPMRPSTPSATTTPQRTTSLTAQMQDRTSSVSTTSRDHLTFPSQSMPPEGSSNTFRACFSTPVLRRGSVVASFDTSIPTLSSTPLAPAAPSTPTPKSAHSAEEPLTPHTESKDDMHVEEAGKETEEGGKGEGVNIFALIISHLPPKATTATTASSDGAEDVYPTPVKEPSSTTLPIDVDAETAAVKKKLFPSSSPAKGATEDGPFWDLATSIRSETPASGKASRASSSATTHRARVTFDDAPVVIDGIQPPSVVRERGSTAALKEVSTPVLKATPRTMSGDEDYAGSASDALGDEKVQEIQRKVTEIIAKQSARAASLSAAEKNVITRQSANAASSSSSSSTSSSTQKQPMTAKKVEVIDLISDDEDEQLPELSTVIGPVNPPKPPGAPKCLDKLPHAKDKQTIKSISQPPKKTATDIWKNASKRSVAKTPKKTPNEVLKAVHEARGVKTIRVKEAASDKPSDAPPANDGSALIDQLQASGAIAHPTVNICGTEVELQILYDLVNEKCGGYQKVEGCDLWGRIATGLSLKYDGAAQELRRVYRETLLGLGKSSAPPIPVPTEQPVIDLETIRKEVANEPAVELETDFSEERATFLSKVGAQAIDPVQHICGTNIELFLLSIVVDKKGGFDVVESQNLWPRIARTLMFRSEIEEEAAAELQRVYTELLLYLDEDISSSQHVSVIQKDGKKVTNQRKPDMIFDRPSLTKFISQVQYVCANTHQAFEESILICSTEIHIFDLWAVVKHKLGGYQKTVVYDKWSRAATLLGFNLSKKSDRNAAVEIQAVWDRLLRNVYIDIAPKYQRPGGPPRSGKDGTLRFSAVEAQMLEDAFRGEGKLPGKKVRERLAREMNVMRASINNWFYTRSSKANLEKRAREQAPKKIPDDTEIIDLDLPAQERRKVDLETENFCQVEGCGRPRISENYQGMQEAKEYLGGVAGELIAINEDGGQVVEEGADEMELERPMSQKRRRAIVPGVGTAYRVHLKHTCGMTESEADDSWGLVEQEDDDQARGSEAENVDHWEDPKEYNALDGIERFAGMAAKDLQHHEESNEEWSQSDEEWDHDMVVAPLNDKTAQEIRVQIDAQFGEFSFSRKSSGATEREEISPYGTVRKVFEDDAYQSVEDDIHRSSQEVAPAEDVEMGDGNEAASNAVISPVEDDLFVGQSPAPVAPGPLVAPVAAMRQDSYPKKSSIKYAKSKNGKPFWPTSEQQKRMSLSELRELVQSRRSSSMAEELDQISRDVVEQSGEGSLLVHLEDSANENRMVEDSGTNISQVDSLQEHDLDEQMGGMEETPEIDGDLRDIGESILKRQKEREAASRRGSVVEANLSPSAKKIIASIATPGLQAQPVVAREGDISPPAATAPKNVVRPSDFVIYRRGKAVVDETAAWASFEENLIGAKEFAALSQVAKGEMSIELFEINCAFLAGEVGDEAFEKLKKFFIGECSFKELEMAVANGEGVQARTARIGEIEKPMLKALMNRANFCAGADGMCDEEKLVTCRKW